MGTQLLRNVMSPSREVVKIEVFSKGKMLNEINVKFSEYLLM